jgi:His-Xaa-Ser system radical SAM maturase HxsB
LNLLTPLTVDPKALDTSKVAFFRYGVVDGRVLVTNDAGEFHFLSKGDFDRFLRGKIDPAEALHGELATKGFLKGHLDAEKLAGRIRRKKAFLGGGPHLHIVVATLRCNHACKYCHASRTDMDRVDTDMSLETARQVVDFAMQTPSPVVNFEFQGGEPTVNFPVVKFVTEYALEKNRYENREILVSLVNNLTYMDDEKMRFLVDKGVMVCTSLDGPEDVHNANRGWIGKGSSWATVTSWMDKFNAAYKANGLDPNLFHVDALMTTTRASLKKGREIVDTYVERGIKSVHLRPLNPFGFATATWKQIGYTMEEFLEFYQDTFEYILQLNRQGVFIQERMAAMFLTKMLTPDDPNYTDCRSPAGSGTAQLAYNFDGSIYTCDEGRMVAHMGNDFFKLGHVSHSTWKDVTTHPTVKALAVASIQDALPACSTCVYKPSCGIQPIHNYMFDGDLFGQRPRSRKCQEFYGQQQYLYGLLANDTDGSIEKIFRRWTIQRSRPGTIPWSSDPATSTGSA